VQIAHAAGFIFAQGKNQPSPSGKSLMCAYKLCKVEFRYWGMQSKIEKFIHDVGEFVIEQVEILFIIASSLFFAFLDYGSA
jgi:Phosphatidylinositol transfer protein